MKHLKVLLSLPLVVAVVAAIVIVPGKSQEQQPRRTKARPGMFDETRFPMADYIAAEPTDAAARAKRQARGKKYNSSSWGLHPDAHGDSVVRTDYVDTRLPALPFHKSSAVIVGQVNDAAAYVSNDKGGVYSVFTIQVNEVLKAPETSALSSASVIEVEREGGRVRFPNGRVRIYMISGLGMPRIGVRYAVFLRDSVTGFELVTGYEMSEGQVYPLDDLPNSRIYEGNDEITFLSHLRTKSKSPTEPSKTIQ